MTKSKSILITRFSALGDVAMCVAPVYSVCRRNPEKKFYFLTRPHTAALFVNTPSNLHLLKIEKGDFEGFFGLFRLWRSLSKEYNIDTFIDLHDVLRTKALRLLFFLSGANVKRLKKERVAKRMMTRRHRKIIVPIRPTILRYHDVFIKSHLECDSIFESIIADNDEFLCRHFVSRKEGIIRIAVAPFAAHPAKQYPLDLMEKVVAMLSEHNNMEIILLGNSSNTNEYSVMQQWQATYPRVSANVSAESMHSQLACLASCDALISMDSANMHMASLVGTRVISIWGATHPYAGFYGYGQDFRDVVQVEMPCRPCSVFGNRPCRHKDFRCLKSIKPETILSFLFRDKLL